MLGIYNAWIIMLFGKNILDEDKLKKKPSYVTNSYLYFIFFNNCKA